MNRKDFIEAALKTGACGCALGPLLFAAAPRAEAQAAPADELASLRREKEFLTNWLTDLFDSMARELDPATRAKVVGGCGRRCFERHSFKRDIAEAGRAGGLDALIEAYHKNFEAWREGDLVHVRFGETSNVCYCPAARFHPVRPDDAHCECTRATHAAIFETALGRPVEVRVVETLRRGGKTCHFVAKV